MSLTDDPIGTSKTFGLGLCASGKYRYDTVHAGQRGQKAFARKSRKHLTIYRCDECHGWHLGNAGRSR